MIRPPTGVLPAPRSGDLPPPSRLRAMLGPSVILAGLSIGSGEFVLWPRLTAEWGLTLFWAAWIGVTIQFFLNMEIERITLATGESAVTGFLRLSRVFGPVFLLCGTLPWIWPGWATGAATIVVWQTGGSVAGLAIAGLVLCGLILSLGPVIYRTVEAIQIVLVAAIFGLLGSLALLVVPGEALGALARGALRIGHVPEGVHLPLLLGALAFAGAGGTVNLAQSNYIKDKGYGMGRWIGRITSPLTGGDEGASEIGIAVQETPENLARWRVWWRRTNLEHFLSFYLVCVLCLALLCLLTFSLLEPGAPVSPGFGFIRDQADALRRGFGPVAEWLFLGAGVAVLFSTELALLDAVSRVAADVVKVAVDHARLPLLRRLARLSLSSFYFVILWGFIAFGCAVLLAGLESPLLLLILSASLNAAVMFLYSGLLLWLNLRTFRGPLRPGPVRIVALLVAFGFFGYFTLLTLLDRFAALLA
jgi:hypothetical protein